ncbi:MAG: preprotein translocase subunit SecA [Luteibaculaceae bacterium]
MSLFNNILKKIIGDKTSKDLEEVGPIVEKIKSIYPEIEALSNDELRTRVQTIKQKIADYIAPDEAKIEELKNTAENLDESKLTEKESLYDQADSIEKEIDKKLEEILEQVLPEVFAVVKETAARFTNNPELEVSALPYDYDLAQERDFVEIRGDKAIYKNHWNAAGTPINWNMVHYDVQLIGGYALHKGKIAEMQTGEGKTLVSTLPVFLNALTGKGVHVITVNDYLAKRDAEWMGPIHQFHGLTVDCIDKHQPNSEARRKAYNADITYGTNNEFGFDYLRDNMATDPQLLVQRKHHFAIVDEVDSVLIDDARTPLIISGPVPQGDRHEFAELKPRVEKVFNAQKILVTNLLAEAKKKLANLEGGDKQSLTEGGLALLRAHRGMPKNKALVKFLSEPGVRAMLQKTENYYMQDQGKEMYKVDEELYFHIDEKTNGIELTDKGLELLSGDKDASSFILPDIGNTIAQIEKSATAEEEKIKQKEEAIRNYSVMAERVHTLNQLLKAYSLFEKDVEYVVMDGAVKIVDEQTGRIMEGRRYSDGLHQAIEAKENVKIESASQTMATITLQNYFRMYHKLAGMTGTAETEAKELWDIYKLDVMSIPTNKPVVRKDLEDLVYKTKREKYNAISDEIVRLTEAGRPVLVGTTSVEVSELLSRMLTIKKIKHNVLNAKLHRKEADIVAEAGLPGTVTIATNMAGRGTDIKLGPGVKDAGGLAIIGTERHESRRIDRQLRGRAGRQGDPGSSQFFVSLEDNLMRLFGSERIAKLMDRMGLEEGEVIQHSMITKSIERAQKKVEENNFGIRKRLLEFDDVMNAQREVIYKKRKYALFGDRLSFDIENMFYGVSEAIISDALEVKSYAQLKLDALKYFGIEPDFSEDEFNSLSLDQMADALYTKSITRYQDKSKWLTDAAFPVIKDVYEKQGEKYQNIVIPFTDGRKTLQVVTNLKKAYESNGKELTKAFEKNISLAIIDLTWKDHLREMDDLKQSVHNAVYEQKDPLLIYKFESYKLFSKMNSKLSMEIVAFLSQAMLPQTAPTTATNNTMARQQSKTVESRQAEPAMVGPGRPTGPNNAPQRENKQRVLVQEQPMVSEKKYGRNDKVTIFNVLSGEKKEVKYKQAEPLIEEGNWKLLEDKG